MSLQERYERIQKHVADVCSACNREVDSVVIMGVSKTVTADVVAEAIEAGISDFGENRPEQLIEKHDRYPQVRWHFIGNIQSRQLKHVVGRACCIHSLYKLEHAQKINALAQEQGIVQHVLLEVNDGEDNKQGLNPDDVWDMLLACCKMDYIAVDGFMVMAPQADQETVSSVFEGLRNLRDSLRDKLEACGISNVALDTLSMGMSNDYPLAIAQGSTIVRVGRAIFSESFA